MGKKYIDIWELKKGDKVMDPDGMVWEVREIVRREYAGFFLRATGWDDNDKFRMVQGYRDKTKVCIVA
ncbi:hypothetical protein [Carboxydothermus hydrogenoformans]|uniref:Uncharacterized protein n=1 Tax=Carboxydothermus hydrogenoformans (strain ATCC BAA-161 / DSM 6008 / Z-2901) TaxID=246194 RepID=Q3ABG9_CARHZ|nr:hypothetical protein [Carboxydothermus hydrogenoformans]ABB14051.1 hypothetical protein CHY_1695 [Carboxydothermus hydrogenoformans Z-2901]